MKTDSRIAALKTALERFGYKEDRYGHMAKEIASKRLDKAGKPVSLIVRVKMQSVSVRVEVKSAESGSEWGKVDSAYLKDIEVSWEGVKIGQHVLK